MKVKDRTVGEIAAAMKQDPETWARLYLETVKQLDVVLTKVEGSLAQIQSDAMEEKEGASEH